MYEVQKDTIIEGLNILHELYINSEDPHQRKMVCRLALIELCTWYEDNWKQMQMQYFQDCWEIPQEQFDGMFRSIYGFAFKSNQFFKPIKVWNGEIFYQNCLVLLNEPLFEGIRAEVGRLKARRGDAAHKQTELFGSLPWENDNPNFLIGKVEILARFLSDFSVALLDLHNGWYIRDSKFNFARI